MKGAQIVAVDDGGEEYNADWENCNYAKTGLCALAVICALQSKVYRNERYIEYGECLQENDTIGQVTSV